ncbi:hypothetical protein [Nocardia sp. CDC160]|uniref:hypothetical protein n=1 Tax=Nocardia sp. CDC160 TaxID=3112166 RepID=UPI002DBF04CE|nr:hypothetical protein [Nocardia sp. CDC160]MEC3916086.1 hypothetical protein [Nocardia sp. CDC160]
MSGLQWGTVPAWVAAFGQMSTALIAAYIAYIAFKHSKRSIEATCQKNLADLVNEFNRMILQPEEHVAAAAKLRDPVQTHLEDSIIFCYLNFIQTSFEMVRNDLIPKEPGDASIRNGVAWLARMDRRMLAEYLSRGYGTDFRDHVLVEYDKLPH